MKDRSELLSLISELLVERLGPDLIGRTAHGAVIVAGQSQAFVVDLMTVEGSDRGSQHSFGKRFIAEQRLRT